jgi:hypothetical protein
MTSRTPIGEDKDADIDALHRECQQHLAEIQQLRDSERRVLGEASTLAREIERLRAALTRIEKWFGEFPETGKFWEDDATRPMSYGACYGSNGERDFMRQIARDALSGAVEQTAPRNDEPTD